MGDRCTRRVSHHKYPRHVEQRALAACLGCQAVASYATAGVLHRIDGVRPGRVHVTVAHGRRVTPRGVVVHHARHLDRRDVTGVQGIPATAIARTLVDLAGRLTEKELIEAVDSTVVERRVTPDGVRAAMERAGPAR